jgi:hypothetical protein
MHHSDFWMRFRIVFHQPLKWDVYKNLIDQMK